MYEEAYRCGQGVYEGKMRITKAQDRLEARGMNRSSAADLVYNFGHLRDGECYKRAMSVGTTDDYLTWILRDYGADAHRKGIEALKQHLEYFQARVGPRSRGLRRVLEKHSEIAAESSGFFVSSGEEPAADGPMNEGRTKSVWVNVYERNPLARRLCIGKYGAACAVCGFDFRLNYGAIGEGFIHVHHLRELASIGKEYQVDAERDLRPVCPNCHAMLHRRRPALGIEELRGLIRDQDVARAR
jgi:5-methylcytosine-specific restriction protein A